MSTGVHLALGNHEATSSILCDECVCTLASVAGGVGIQVGRRTTPSATRIQVRSLPWPPGPGLVEYG